MANDETTKKIIQKGNTAGGDISAGDIYKPTIIVGSVSALRRRSQELKELYATNEDYRGLIDKLQKFLNKAEENHAVRGVEAKLTAGGRSDLIPDALLLKERFFKKISKHQFSEQAQELFAHILAEIHTFFSCKVRPKIQERASNSTIDSLIYDELIKKIYEDVGDNALNIDMQDIRGMLFYLTGNCHLEWK